jgi:hypothetical protein
VLGPTSALCGLLFFLLLIYPPTAAQRGGRAGGLWGGIPAPQNSILRARAKNRLASPLPSTPLAPRGQCSARLPCAGAEPGAQGPSPWWSEPSDLSVRRTARLRGGATWAQHWPRRPARCAAGGALCGAPGWPPLTHPPTGVQGGARAGGLWGGIPAPRKLNSAGPG